MISFVATQEKYILSAEAAILSVFLVEILARIISHNAHTPEIVNYSTRLKIIVRIIGYLIASAAVVSILASNPVLAISVGTIAGVVIAFATQNIISSILATVVLLNTHMVRVGEEISISGVTGVVADIRLTHTIVSVADDIVYIPNSVMISAAVRRKKRTPDSNQDVQSW